MRSILRIGLPLTIPLVVAGSVSSTGTAEPGRCGTPGVEGHMPARGVARHPTVGPGAEVAYVDDVRGPDSLVVAGPLGFRRVPAAGEVTHPTISPGGRLGWAEDMVRIAVGAPGGEGVERFDGPPGTIAVFSPVFVSPDRLVAVAAEPVRGVGPGEAARDNLWSLDLRSGRWERLSSFGGGSERWTALRTPVAGPSGGVWFVRVTGFASETEPPRFELWRLEGEGVRRIRALPEEMFLVGVSEEGLLWNVRDHGSRWRIAVGNGTDLRLLGCGAVSVDPDADPDLGPVEPGTGGDPLPVLSGPAGSLGIAVGDFANRETARAVADLLPGARVIGHGAQPAAVGPKRHAAMVPLGTEVDVIAELRRMQGLLPELAPRMWVVPLS